MNRTVEAVPGTTGIAFRGRTAGCSPNTALNPARQLRRCVVTLGGTRQWSSG